MKKTNFTDAEIKEIADFAMTNKKFQKEQEEITNSLLDSVKRNNEYRKAQFGIK